MTGYNFFVKISLDRKDVDMREKNMLKELKVSLFLIILGNVLYWTLEFLSSDNNSAFSEFTMGILLGISVGMNIIGILLLIYYIVKYDQKSE